MIDLALQLLHIAMSDILVSWVLLVTFAVFLFKPGLSISNFLVYILDHPVDVLPLANLDKDAPLEVQHWLLNNPVVEVDHVT